MADGWRIAAINPESRKIPRAYDNICPRQSRACVIHPGSKGRVLALGRRLGKKKTS